MFDWLQKYTGHKIYGENVDSSELDNLKKQLKYYKKNMKKKIKKWKF